MATAGPSRKSYAEVVKTDPPTEPMRRFKTVANEDEWTDVSSMTSCSWPSFVDDEVASESHGHSRNDHEAELNPLSFTNVYDQSVFDDDVLCESEDTRAERVLAGFVNHTSRERRLYNELGVCRVEAVGGKSAKPWKPFPGCHDDCLRIKVGTRRGRDLVRKRERDYIKQEARDGQGSFGQ